MFKLPFDLPLWFIVGFLLIAGVAGALTYLHEKRHPYRKPGADNPPPSPEIRPGINSSDSDMEWFFPPDDVHTPELWDRYWSEQVAHGMGPLMCDLFSDDNELVEVMVQEGMQRVLCVGSGISQEPRALAAAGFDVTVLDLSPAALQLAQLWPLQPDEIAHVLEERLLREGGRVEFVAGDLTDADVCPGPFDVIVERCTLQLFTQEERPQALQALEARLRPDGILLSHCHQGNWRPPQPRVHFLRDLFQQRGWTICEGQPGAKPAGRVALLEFSTG